MGQVDQPIVVGRIGAAHGVRGWVRIISYTDPLSNLLGYVPFLSAPDPGEGGGFTPVKMAQIRPHRDQFVAKITGVDDRDHARALMNTALCVARCRLPALKASDGYYWQDLIGLSVHETTRGIIGRVVDLMRTGANDVLVVQREDGTEELIPFIRSVVQTIDMQGERLLINWLEP